MTRDEIINTTDCPKCGAKAGHPCREADGSERAQRKNHVERVYRAQDIASGKPDRTTGEQGHDHLAQRRCPICHKALKSRQGATDHMVGAHGLTRDEAKARRREYVQRHGFADLSMQRGSKRPKRLPPLTRPAKETVADFDVIDDGDF